jgi:hypothetical protein
MAVFGLALTGFWGLMVFPIQGLFSAVARGIYANMERHKKNKSKAETETADQAALPVPDAAAMPHELNGPKGPEPTRYGDWEQKGRCTDF